VSRITGVVVGTLAAGAVLGVSSIAIATFAFRRQISQEITDLLAAAQGVQPTVLTEADIADLPDPVQRWLRQAQVIGRERPTTVRLKQDGEFRRTEAENWMPFAAEEYTRPIRQGSSGRWR